ncbi:MAG TPA: YbdK family carboxylate-amine ligase [Gaiellaceae bacterium]|nr:YbdK family carboxylate-amine ligase [Gaiellaceae bacterium]
MIEAHFGESAPLTVGIEEELMILDAETLWPTDAVGVFVRESEALDLPGKLKTELHASVVEASTEICTDVAEAIEAVRALRVAAAEIAARNGLAIAAAGVHPTATLESLPVVQEERYLAMVKDVGYAARRQGVNGLHVHVGVESADACYERLEAVLPWLPVVLALSANSPFVAGEPTGMQSTRASILGELPRAGAPPAFGSYAAWERWVERLVGLGVIEDHTRIWWDVRPAPRFGTLEIRIADQPTSVERTQLLAEAIVTLVERSSARPGEPAARGDYLQNRWSAARFGLDADLIHPDGDRLAGVRELAAELFGFDPPAPEAIHQLEVAAADGMRAVAADIVERTLR